MTDNDGERDALQAQLATARADALREAAAEASGRQGRSARDSQFNIGWYLACASIQSDILALIPAMGERPANDDCRYDFEVALKDDNERLRKRLSAMPWLIGC